MSEFEQVMPPDGTWLPESVPIEHFDYSVYGQIALYYWQHQETDYLVDAIVPVAKKLDDNDLCELVEVLADKTITLLGAESDRYTEEQNLERLSFTAEEVALGSDIIRPKTLEYLIKMSQEFGGYCDEILETALVNAAIIYAGSDFADGLKTNLEKESARRFRLSILKMVRPRQP